MGMTLFSIMLLPAKPTVMMPRDTTLLGLSKIQPSALAKTKALTRLVAKANSLNRLELTPTRLTVDFFLRYTQLWEWVQVKLRGR
jgi:hypothetical protein